MTTSEQAEVIRQEKYRKQVRETMQAFSDEALAYQDRIIVGGIDREECDREIERRTRERDNFDFEMIEPPPGWSRQRYASPGGAAATGQTKPYAQAG